MDYWGGGGAGSKWRLFVLSFIPLDVLDEVWDLIESISEGFLTYSYMELGFIRLIATITNEHSVVKVCSHTEL